MLERKNKYKKKDNHKLKKIFFIFIYFISGFYSPVFIPWLINTSLFLLGSIFYYLVYFPLQFLGLEQKLWIILGFYGLIILIIGLLLQYRIFYSVIPNLENYANYKLKKLTSVKYRNNIFRLLTRFWWFFCYFFTGPGLLILLLLLSITPFKSDSKKAKAAAAANSVATIAKECAVKIADDPFRIHTYSQPTLNGYSSFTVNGSTTKCSNTGIIVAKSSNTSKYPTFKYNIDTGAKTCVASGDAIGLGCVNGKW